MEGIGRKNVKIVLVLKDLSQGFVCGTAVESADWSYVVSLWLDDLPVCYVLLGRICDIWASVFSPVQCLGPLRVVLCASHVHSRRPSTPVSIVLGARQIISLTSCHQSPRHMNCHM